MPETTNPSANKSGQKPRLGRGLGSLLGAAVEPPVSVENKSLNAPDSTAINRPSSLEKGALEKSVPQAVGSANDDGRIWMVPIEKLTANERQPRQTFESESLHELSQSIRQQGILQPITARRLDEGRFEIIAGERRWRAAQMAGLKEVPVILKAADGKTSLEWAVLENIQRSDLNPIEEAEAYDSLIKDFGQTQAQVADRLGKERSTVANSLRLLVLPPEVKLMVCGGQLSAGHAKVLLGLDAMSDQISMAKEVVRERLSVRALERKVMERKGQAPVSANSEHSAVSVNVSTKLVESLAQELQKLIGTRIVIDYTAGRGKLGVYFHSDEQLTEIVERMRRGWSKPTPAKQENPTGSFRT